MDTTDTIPDTSFKKITDHHDIHHVVLAGGGPSIFQTIGAIQYLLEDAVILPENIQSVYGTSAGSIVGVLLCIGMEWNDVFEYFVNRPWHDTFPVSPTLFLDSYINKGVFDSSFVETVFKPIFDSKDIDTDITLKELYDLSSIDLHVFSFELHEFVTCEFSHSTHPDMRVVDAVYRSSALPFVFSPHCQDAKCYLDGGLFANYPLQACIDNGYSPDNIIGMKNSYEVYDNETSSSQIITHDSTILDYVSTLISKIVRHVNTDKMQPRIDNEIEFQSQRMSLPYISEVLKSKELRKDLCSKGRGEAANYLTRWRGGEDNDQAS